MIDNILSFAFGVIVGVFLLIVICSIIVSDEDREE